VTVREKLLVAVSRRIEEGPDGPSGYLDMGAVIEAAQLAQVLRDDDGTPEEWQRLGVLHVLRYTHPEGGFPHDLLNAVWAYTPCFLAGTEGVPEPLLSPVADHAESTATALAQSVMAAAGPSALSDVLWLWERILEATPTDHPRRAMRLNALGGLLQTRAERTGPGQAQSEADFTRAVALFREALSVLAPDNPQRAFVLNNVGAAFQARYEQTGSASDLDLAIEALRAAVAAPRPAGSTPLTSLLNLTDALQARSKLSDDPGDLDDAIRYGREAVDLLEPDAADHGRRLANLGLSLYRRYLRSHVHADLDAAAEILRSASESPGGERFSDAPYCARSTQRPVSPRTWKQRSTLCVRPLARPASTWIPRPAVPAGPRSCVCWGRGWPHGMG
jgi:hypothetical protein